MSAGQTELSVIIASRDRRERLRRCLDTLAAQTADPDRFEVIVADDGSEDGTAAMLESLDLPLRLRPMRLPPRGKSAALNAAIATAEGRVCLFVDDDIVAVDELVAEHLAAHDNGPVLGIGRIVEQPPDREDWYARAFAKGWEEHNAELEHRRAEWTDCYGANFSAPRATLEEIGGFSLDLPVAEDFDIAFRLWRSGCEPTYLAQAIGIHDDQKRFRRMLEDAANQGGAHLTLCERFPETREALLDWHGSGAGNGELAMRRVCLALRIPPVALARLGRLVPGSGRKMIWLHFVRRLAFWSGVRAAASAEEWAALRPAVRAPVGLAVGPPLLSALELCDTIPL